jgi:peptidoglycan glycosyltransferase
MLANDLNRNREMELLLVTTVIAAVGFIVVAYMHSAKSLDVIKFILGYGGVFLALHWMLKSKCHTGDPLLLPIVGCLVAIGLVFLFRLQPNLLPYQLLWCGAGGLGFFGVTHLFRSPELLQKYKYISGVLSILMIFSTVLFGVDIGGNKSWLVLGPISFEPVEFSKILLVVFLAGYLVENRMMLATSTWRIGKFSLPHPRYLGPLIALWGIGLLLLVLEKDLGAALLYYGTFLSMLYIASGRKAYVAIGLVLIVAGGIISYQLFGHVRIRFDMWLNPWSDPTGRGYQIVQALFALGTGGIFGTGLSLGRPDYIPAVHTDFVFAAIGEELGLAGTLAVLLLFVLFIHRGFRIALVTQDQFCRLLAAGFSSLLALQTVVIIGGVTKFLPLTGITLPFISYGGSSMLSNFLILGLLHNISEKR